MKRLRAHTTVGPQAKFVEREGHGRAERPALDGPWPAARRPARAHGLAREIFFHCTQIETTSFWFFLVSAKKRKMVKKVIGLPMAFFTESPANSAVAQRLV